MPKTSEKNSVGWHSNPHAIKKNFSSKRFVPCCLRDSLKFIDCFESFSPLNNVVTEGVITT